MIFVAVGSSMEGFVRLLNIIVELIQEGDIKEEVFAQIEHSRYTPIHYKFSKFVTHEEYDELIKRSKVLINAGGAAAIASTLKEKKISISFPRLPEFNEVFDDREHALQLSERLKDEGVILLALNKEQLSEAIKKVETFKPCYHNLEEKKLSK